ncbi:MAG: bifunctional phosphopantothenoylcysteine decarboxylase/phosphopantothenate--cysteine ligase CoaBC [Micrococcales bacterium]
MKIFFGITGGIAAFKATSLIRMFTEAGHEVKVVPTQNALRFIGSTTLEALSHNTVDSDLYTDVESVKHVQLGQEADLVVVAPASAAFLARYAAGMADDLLLNALLATKAPVLVAPAMHTEMWENPATTANVSKLRSRGIFVLEPASGRLTGEDTGKGRMPEPESIHKAALALLVNRQNLAGKHVLVSAGGTREQIDPVRFIGNHSSGKQGVAIAFAAQAAGARVTLVAANVEFELSGLQNVIRVNTAQELQAEITKRLDDSDAVVMTAAVSDFRVANPSDQKIKRSELGNELSIKLVANPDILAGIVASGYQGVTVGFAAETAGSLSRLATLAEKKLADKGCDLLVANDVSEGKVFGEDHTQVYLLDRSGRSTEIDGSKAEIASAVVDAISRLLK